MAKSTLYVMQDGAYFHMFDDADCTKLRRVEQAPFKVRDGDFKAAQRAREWFLEWGYAKGGPDGSEVIWLGP